MFEREILNSDDPFLNMFVNILISIHRFRSDIFVENALKKLNKGGMLIIECSSNETLEGFDKIAKFGDTNLLYWKV